MIKKRIVFLTGTRADFGKIKSLIEAVNKSPRYELYIFATGMHMSVKYGKTVDEIVKCRYKNIFKYYNHTEHDSMDIILAKTIEGFSHYIHDIKPDLIVVHGDRVEALAGAITGSLHNILTAHIEGGELSGTIDEFIRHSTSKLSHIHLVANVSAQKRLEQMGESKKSIYVIGSPDVDIMISKTLPSLSFVKKYYDIDFQEYGLLMFHPVTTEIDDTPQQAKNLVDAVLESGKRYVVIYPNNDHGSDYIFREYKRLEKNRRFRIFPSLRFEYFIVLLKNAKFIIGNSSAGIREAPYFGIPAIDIGTRQRNRLRSKDLIHTNDKKINILRAIHRAMNLEIRNKNKYFGKGNSAKLFLKVLNSKKFWEQQKQKQFHDI